MKKHLKRNKFLEQYEPSTEIYRLKMQYYANKVRQLIYNRKLDILSGKIKVKGYG